MNFKDVYYEEKYGKLCEITDSGTLEIFTTSSPHGTIRNMFIKKTLPIELDSSGTFFDITTPYGYGGPIITDITDSKELLIKDYEKQFTHYCKENNIITEFVRFHPLLRNHEDFEHFYHPQMIRHTVVTEVNPESDPYETQFSKSVKKKIRRALNHDLTVEIVETPKDLSVFKDIYYDTMDRNSAEEYYYFDDAYFDYLTDHLQAYLINVSIYSEGVCIASGLYFVYGEILQIHLSGTRQDYLHLSPAYLLRYHAILWARDHNIRFVHHGGGTDNTPENPLLSFKKKFSKSDLLSFYIGTRVYDEEKYHELVLKTNTQNTQFFPKYRG